MRKLFIFLLISSFATSQTLKLEDCYNLAYENSPLSSSLKNYKLLKDKKLLNTNAAYYPDFNISAQAKYQSDVIQLPFKIPTISVPEIPKDNYQITLNINQVIWDGNLTKSQNEIIEMQYNMDNSNIEVELYKLHEKVNNSYFGILALRVKFNLLTLTISDLNSKITDLESKIKNGIALQSNADFLKSEMFKLQASLFDIKSNITTFENMLSMIIGKVVKYEDLSIPNNLEIPSFDLTNRRELSSFKNSKELINSSKNLIDAKYFPKVFAFAQAGYGKPGLNMFYPDFATFWVAGIKASWNPWSWGSQDREKEIIEIQTELIKIQEENFKKNMEILSISDKNEIEKVINNLKMDDEIIDLKKSILKTTEAKFDGGVISALDYYNDLTALRLAEMNKENHKIDLVKYINSYKTTLGVK